MTNIICDENHHYWINEGKTEVPGVTQILQAVGISDFSMVPEQLLNRAINYGKAVHFACEYWDKGILNLEALDIQLLPVLEQWKKFLKDYEIQLIPEWIEKVSFCKKERFAGTPDRVCVIKNKNIILDIKTGAPSIATPIQTAAYHILVEESGLKIKGRWIIYLSGEKYNIKVCEKQSDFSVFHSALNIYNWKKNNGK